MSAWVMIHTTQAMRQWFRDNFWDEVGVEDVVAVRRALPKGEVDHLPICIGARRHQQVALEEALEHVTVSLTNKQSPGAAFAVIKSATWL